jgi:GNAT superfamily N-acetyltransferase
MTNSGYTFILANWRNDADDIRSVREAVLRGDHGGNWNFADALADEQAFHVLAYDSAGRAVGAARMQPDGRIDYLAVHKPWRGVTVGGALLMYLLHIARKRQLGRVWAVVPAHARKFFEKNRFVSMPGNADGNRGDSRWVREVGSTGQAPDGLH